ncbi:YnfU family zinc-binding protein [Enterobacter mori]|uniref:YnfU family zinc-binding protein n=1 Tax=Enterobacter mori TaxID=539813 RepID=UPI00209AA11E|nr:YnfU family zinc-binding protein [Enterobacter mori]
MSARKNTQFRRNYLVKCPCPNCSKDSEHSYNRVQKGLSWCAHTAVLCSNLPSASK